MFTSKNLVLVLVLSLTAGSMAGVAHADDRDRGGERGGDRGHQVVDNRGGDRGDDHGQADRDREERDRQAQAERDRQEHDRQAQAERDRQAQGERDRQAQMERDRQAQGERERLERDRQAQMERDRLAREQRERDEAFRMAHIHDFNHYAWMPADDVFHNGDRLVYCYSVDNGNVFTQMDETVCGGQIGVRPNYYYFHQRHRTTLDKAKVAQSDISDDGGVKSVASSDAGTLTTVPVEGSQASIK